MTSLRRYATGLSLACTVLALPPGAAAQNIYADQVAEYLDEMETRSLSEGYALEGESVGWMMNGGEGATMITLPAGSYVVVGACDNDCSDIDLVVDRMDSEESLGADREMDSFPIVQFSLDREADVLIGMSMPDCSTARCYAGYRWYSSEVATEMPGADAGTWEEQVMVQLGALPTPDGTAIMDERTGLVGADDETRFSINLDRGSYTGVAVCDADCSDVDLAVYDAGGSLLASDVLEDDVPIVEFNVLKGGGTYYFEVHMITCSTETCGYGFRLYRQNTE